MPRSQLPDQNGANFFVTNSSQSAGGDSHAIIEIDTDSLPSLSDADQAYKALRANCHANHNVSNYAANLSKLVKWVDDYLQTLSEEFPDRYDLKARATKLRAKILYQLAMCELFFASGSNECTLGGALETLEMIIDTDSPKAQKARSTIDSIVEIAVENSDILPIDPKAKSYWLWSLALSSPLVIPVAIVSLPIAISAFITWKVEPMLGLAFFCAVGFGCYKLAPFLIAAATAAAAVVPPVWLVAAAAVGVVTLVALTATYLHLRNKAKQETKTSLFESLRANDSSKITADKQAFIRTQTLQKLVVFQKGKIHKDSNSFLGSKKSRAKPN